MGNSSIDNIDQEQGKGQARPRFDQPFCIIGSKGRFAPCYRFYLPPLEPPEDSNSQLAEIQELRSRITHLEAELKRLREQQAQPKPKARRKYTGGIQL